MSNEEQQGPSNVSDLDRRSNDVWYYLWIVQKRLWLLVAVFVVGMTGTLLYVSTLKPEYKATAQLLVTTAKPGSVADDDYTGATYFQTEMIVETQKELLKNPTLGEEVAVRLGLDKEDSGAKKQEPTAFQRFHRMVRSLIWTTKPETEAPEQPLVTQMAQEILAGLEVERLRNSRIITVSYRAANPERAAQVLNEVIKAHMDQEKLRRFKVTKEKLDWLQEQADVRRAALTKAEQDLNEYQKRLKDVSLEERRNITEGKLNSLNKALHEAETARMEAETTRSLLQEHLKSGQSLETFPKTNPLNAEDYDKVRATLMDLRSREIAFTKKYGPKHPQMVQIREQIKALETQIEGLAKQFAERVESEYQLAKSRAEEIKKALDDQKSQVFDLNERSIEYNSKKLEVETNRKLLEQLLTEVSQTGLASTIKESSIQIIAEARVPTEASGPKRFYSLVLGTILSLVTGCLLAFVLEFADSSIKTGDEIERFVKAPFLGLIDKYESDGAAAGKGPAYLLTINTPKSNTSENFRKIRTNIIFSSQESNRRTLLVTSAVPREGKTFVSINLAVVMAQSGKRVLLVDADLRRPLIHKAMTMENTKGLSSFLAGLAGIDDVIAKSQIENLSLVTSGPIPPNQSELLGSEAMRTFLAETVKRFDLIILDCAPVTSVADALVLGSMVDGVVEVVKSHSTARGLLEQSTQHLRDVKAKIIGVILNQVDFKKTGYAYGKYYSYRYYGYYDYSYYASEDEPKLEGGKRAPRPHRRSAPAPSDGDDVKC